MKKVMWIVTILVILISVGIFSFYYFGYYQKSELTGIVIAFAEKGTFYKTYEGEVKIKSFEKVEDQSSKTELFKFSVEKKDEDVINMLKEVMLSGDEVRMEFIQRHAKFFWRGDTEFFIKRVSIMPKVEEKSDDNDVQEDSIPDEIYSPDEEMII
ncbi:MAG: hypothetical protein M9887_09255 [Chitinophagales bacterium]|nr:hypothetical protein [Chitinophagales bacterium]